MYLGEDVPATDEATRLRLERAKQWLVDNGRTLSAADMELYLAACATGATTWTNSRGSILPTPFMDDYYAAEAAAREAQRIADAPHIAQEERDYDTRTRRERTEAGFTTWTDHAGNILPTNNMATALAAEQAAARAAYEAANPTPVRVAPTPTPIPTPAPTPPTSLVAVAPAPDHASDPLAITRDEETGGMIYTMTGTATPVQTMSRRDMRRAEREARRNPQPAQAPITAPPAVKPNALIAAGLGIAALLFFS